MQVFAVAETPVFRRFLVVRMILEHGNRRREYWLSTIFRAFHDKMLISEGRGGLESLNQVISHSSRESSDAQDQSLF